MTENFDLVIFERSLFSRTNNTDAMISLRCNKTNELLYCIPKSLSVTQSIGLFSPLVVVTFTDMNGDLFNNIKPDMSDVFLLKYARSENEVAELRLKIVNVEYTGTVIGSSGNIEFRVTFMGENWYEMNSKCYNRGWSGTISSVVSDIVKDGKYIETKIHSTSGKFESIVQCYETNKSIFTWLLDNAYSDNNDGHYAYGANIDGQFFFKNLDTHINDYRPRMRNNNVITFSLFSPSLDERDTLTKKNNNKSVPAYFVGFSGENNYQNLVNSYASGVVSSYFDFDTGVYKTKQNQVNGLEISSLSDVTSLYDMHGTNRQIHYLGTDNKSQKKAKTKISRNIFNSSTLKIMTEGSPNISIFDVVELDINNTSEFNNTIKNQIHSGFYVVKNVVTSFSFSESVVMTSTIGLTRHGVNRNTIDNFDEMEVTSRGKL